LAQSTKWLSVILLMCAQLLLASCGYWGPGGKPRKPPHAPAQVKAEVVEQGIQIDWNAVPGATRYTVFWGFLPGEFRGLVNTDESALILSGLAKGEMLYLAVTAWNESGESPCSTEQTVVNDDNPRRAGLYLARGQEALQKRDHRLAAAFLSAAIRLDPNNADAYRYRGMLYEQLSKPKLARQDYELAERIFKKKPLSKKPFTD
jgi:tetratricopeptide (TPR) repeat protein